MLKTSLADPFSFENPKYLPEISACPHPSLNSSVIEQDVKKLNLQDRVKLVTPVDSSHPYCSIYSIDGHIQAKIPSESFRSEKKVLHWQEKLGTAKQWTWIQGGIAALIALGAAGAAAIKVHPYIVVAIGVCSVVCAAICGMYLSRAFEASRQIKGWDTDPLEKIANERRKAYEDGFSYVFKNNLKLISNTSNFLLPFEIEYLFKKYSDAFCDDLLSKKPSNPTKKEWLRRFIDCNPIAKDVLTFVYGKVPEDYEKISLDYGILHNHLTNTHSEYIRLRENARQKTEEAKSNIDKQRESTLLPLQTLREHHLAQAFTDCKEKLKVETDPKKIQEIQKEYSAKVAKYHVIYAAAAVPANLGFDAQITKVENNLISVLTKIKENEASSRAWHFDCACKLLEDAKQLKQQPHLSYQSPAIFFEKTVFDISPPPLLKIDAIALAQATEALKKVERSIYSDYLTFLYYELPKQ